MRKVARAWVPSDASEDLMRRIEEAPDDSAAPATPAVPLDPNTIDGLMPGEQARAGMPGESSGLMPGESAGDMSQ